jgi:predicted dehydrogenase
MKLRTAVIGVGYLGRFHAQKYAALETSELVGVYDQDQARSESVAKELGVKSFATLNEVIREAQAVTVATTTPTHFEICNQVLSAGVHVHVEKPITVRSDEGRKLCELADAKNLILQVGHVERFNPVMTAVKEKLRKPLFIECHRLAPFKPRGSDVSVILDLMIHDLDMILHLVGSEPVRVDAVGTPVLTKTTDICNARIQFASGTVANVTASRVSLNAQRKFRVFQATQYLSLDFGSGDVRLMTKVGEAAAGALPQIETDAWNLEKTDALLLETAAFVDAVQGKKPVVVSGRDGVRALELAEQISQQVERSA